VRVSFVRCQCRCPPKIENEKTSTHCNEFVHLILQRKRDSRAIEEARINSIFSSSLVHHRVYRIIIESLVLHAAMAAMVPLIILLLLLLILFPLVFQLVVDVFRPAPQSAVSLAALVAGADARVGNADNGRAAGFIGSNLETIAENLLSAGGDIYGARVDVDDGEISRARLLSGQVVRARVQGVVAAEVDVSHSARERFAGDD
jgi:hypothetical protein